MENIKNGDIVPMTFSRPISLYLWSSHREVHLATEKIFASVRSVTKIQRVRKLEDCLRVVLLNLYVAHTFDPQRYIRYSRGDANYRIARYNPLQIKPKMLRTIVDALLSLGYVECLPPTMHFFRDKRRQPMMRATTALLSALKPFSLSPFMVSPVREAEKVILRDETKRQIDYKDSARTIHWRNQLNIIEKILLQTNLNIYLSDDDFDALNRKMIYGDDTDPENDHLEEEDDPEDEYEEEPRGAIDFTRVSPVRVFNRWFRYGGRMYGLWCQMIPKDERPYITINNGFTVELDYSAMHIHLIYWREGLPVPEGDLYELPGFPAGTRDVVKKCLLTMINAKDREAAMGSIREQIRGYKTRVRDGKKVKLKIKKKKRIVLPPGITDVRKIIKAFEKKHEAIADWFFTGRGVELQYFDSEIALDVTATLAKKKIPCLPIHDSFIVPCENEEELRQTMTEAFYRLTGRTCKIGGRAETLVEKGMRIDITSDHGKSAFSKYIYRDTEWRRIKAL